MKIILLLTLLASIGLSMKTSWAYTNCLQKNCQKEYNECQSSSECLKQFKVCVEKSTLPQINRDSTVSTAIHQCLKPTSVGRNLIACFDINCKSCTKETCYEF